MSTPKRRNRRLLLVGVATAVVLGGPPEGLFGAMQIKQARSRHAQTKHSGR